MERLTTLTGAIAESFEKGSELLQETAGIRLSEASVQRTTEATGQRIGEALEAGSTFGTADPWKWFHDAWDRSVAYVSLDATGVRQQGPHGEAAEGRMAYVGMVFNPRPDPQRVFHHAPRPKESMKARYISGLYPLAEMGPLLRRQAGQVGMNDAEVWIGLSDGGNGLEDHLHANFPLLQVVILDFWHVSERLYGLAKVLHAKDDPAAQEQGKQWSRLLQEEGGETLIGVLEAFDWPTGKAGLRSTREEVMGYLRNHRHRMDYPEYLANGWYIGSGAVESACKTVVGNRLKGSGMRWREDGSHQVCHVRALYRSESSQWQAFWKREIYPPVQKSTN